MVFCRLATLLSLVLAVSGFPNYGDYDTPIPSGSFAEIEEFNGSSYASVSSNYYLVRFPCPGCASKNYGLESLIFNFSTTSDTVLLNGKQIHPQPLHPPEIIAPQVSGYTNLHDINYDLSYSNSHENVRFYPLSRVGYVVNVSSQAHPLGSRDSSLVKMNFRTIQVGNRVLDCLDSLELVLFEVTRGGALAIKGTRFVQNEESYLPYTDRRDKDPRYPYDDYYSGGYVGDYIADSGLAYRPNGYARNNLKPSVTASGFRKCHSLEPKALERKCSTYGRPHLPQHRRSPTTAELIGIVLASVVGGAVTTLLAIYFQAALRKWALGGGSAIRCCSVLVWRRLWRGRTGVIRLPTGSKENGVREPEPELE